MGNQNQKDQICADLVLGLVHATERAAIAAHGQIGRGDEHQADEVAVAAMRAGLNLMDMSGKIVIGEGERDQAPMLFIGEEVGQGGTPIDIAVDPLEGTTLTAKAMPNALAVAAIAPREGLLHAPDVYMEKIAIGPGFPDNTIALDKPPQDNIKALAKARGIKPKDITACILDRPRHNDLIEAVRQTGAAVNLITDGDIAGVIHTTQPASSGIDIYMGIGGAPEGVLAAAALRCVGGQMQGRLVLDSKEKKHRAAQMGIKDPDHIYTIADMVRGDVVFSATGVTGGSLLQRCESHQGSYQTHSLLLHAAEGLMRYIRTDHPKQGGSVK